MKHTTATRMGAALFIALLAAPLHAASHSDAPLIKQDPQANITDVYAFVGTKHNDPATRVLNVLVTVRPFSEPGDGVIYERFADDALYSIHLTNPRTGRPFQRFDFEFSDVNPVGGKGLKNPNTILSYGLGIDAGPISEIGGTTQNYTQTYSVRRNGKRIGRDLVTAPPNIGANTTPDYNGEDGRAVSGATDAESLDNLTKQAVHDLGWDIVTFAGPREDGFYADTPAIFDLLDGRILNNNGNADDGLGQDGSGVDGFKGFNVLAIGIQIPLHSLPSFPYQDAFFGDSRGVGVYASVSRRQLSIRRANNDPVNTGRWIQVNRMGNPLFNEALVPLKDKDRYNRSEPKRDHVHFARYARNSELAFLINFVVFGDDTGQAPLATTGRTDLAAVFIPDVLRVNTATAPVRLPGQSGYNRLSFIGGDGATVPGADRTDASNHVAAGGWPNGRRIGDDVIDIALTAVASGPTYDSITVVGDNTDANDQLYNQVFPYLGTPHAGPAVNQRQAP